VPCQVIATGLTPRRPGQRIKPDQRDARTRVRLFRAGELTAIHVPSEAEEAVRDFRRCREDVRRDVLRWTHRVVKVLDRHGRRYLAGRNRTRSHWTWLRGQRFEVPAWPRTLEVSLFTLEQALARLGELDREVETLAQTAPSRQAIGWLRGFRGLDTSVGDDAFPRPRALMAYLGLGLRRALLGDGQRRGALTKAGNTQARRVLVEAAWSLSPPSRPWPDPDPPAPRAAGGVPGPTPGAHSSAGTGAIGISSGTGSGRRSPWPPWAATGRRGRECLALSVPMIVPTTLQDCPS